jgi:hypothetical protein
MLFEIALPSQFDVTGPQNKCHLSPIQMDFALFHYFVQMGRVD